MGKRESKKGPPKMADVASVWIHSTRMTAHFGHIEDECKLGCGQPMSAAYQRVSIDPESYWPRCFNCFPDADK